MKNLQFLCFAWFVLFSTLLNAQTTFIDTSRVDEFISEVYAEVVNDLGYNKPEGRERFENILKRVEIRVDDSISENFLYLSQIPIIITYNKNLKSNIPFDPKDFNPLMYKFDFNNKYKDVFYKVDGTSYIIVIKAE